MEESYYGGYISRWAYPLLAGIIVLMLGLLSWGISMGNLWAAMCAGVLLAIVIVLGGSILLIPDNRRSQELERTLTIASSTLEHMNGGLNADNCNAVCQLLLPETQATGICMTDTKHVLAFVGDHAPAYPPGSPVSGPTLEVLRSGRIETFSTRDLERGASMGFPGYENSPSKVEGFPVAIIAPLVVSDVPVGTIKLYYRSGQQVDRSQLTIARCFAKLLSTQLSAYELDRQAELTARAEVKALQAQINPHFLFNTLNTIAALTRTDPTRARDLLREFSTFYRRTLEASESRIPLTQELEQTRRYLTIERARFGEDRIVDTSQVEDGLGEVLVPSFLVQPIVENSVRHAMRDDGPLHIDVHVATDGRDVLIAVADDGLGMDDEAAERLLANTHAPQGNEQGTGIALRNVAERIERFYGLGSGIEILSKPGQGTVVTLRLAEAAPAYTMS